MLEVLYWFLEKDMQQKWREQDLVVPCGLMTLAWKSVAMRLLNISISPNFITYWVILYATILLWKKVSKLSKNSRLIWKLDKVSYKSPV